MARPGVESGFSRIGYFRPGLTYDVDLGQALSALRALVRCRGSLLTLKLADGVPVKPSDGHRWPARRGHDGDGHHDGGRHGVADDHASTMAMAVTVEGG